MNNQQAFDRSLAGIRGQNYRRAMNAGFCTYYVKEGSATTRQGDKCGVGHLLSDELARSPELQGTVAMLMSRAGYGNEKAFVLARQFRDEMVGVSTELLVQLQNAHDTLLKRTEKNEGENLAAVYEQRMAQVAEQFGLTYTEPETV